MNNKPILPVIVGRGMAGQAIHKSLVIIAQNDRELSLLPPRTVERGKPLRDYCSVQAENVLFLANPSGLHAQSICEGAAAGFSAIAAEKPVCVRPGELSLLAQIKTPVTVFHGYRVMWGTRTIKDMVESGALGDVFCFECRYWQSSSAQLALRATPDKRSWKNDPPLNGDWDTLTDLASHVADLCLHLMADTPVRSQCWVSYRNAPATHRDTHVHLALDFSGKRRGLASISKTVHGATNNLEYTVLGSKGSATWRFLRPDEVELGSGNQIRLLRREAKNQGSGSSPFHGLGWLEGYVEITQQTLRRVSGLHSSPIPTLEEALAVMDTLLNTSVDFGR
jgi:predicted dehydrogenase